MSPQGKEALAVVESRLAELIASATTEQVRAKLGNLNHVCHKLVVEAAQRLTVPTVVERYKGLFSVPEHSLAESSIRNKRDGANPYAALYGAWVAAADIVLAPARHSRRSAGTSEILSTDDIACIADPVLRHQVGLVFAQNRSLKSQLDILKRAEGAQTVRLVGADGFAGDVPSADKIALSEPEIEALKNFLDPRQLAARGLRIAKDGVIEFADGRGLTDPGFRQALEKIVRSYEKADDQSW